MEEKKINASDFNQWVNQYTSEMLSWALHKVSNRENAEDLVQETFLAAYQSLQRFEQKSSPKTWLLSILNNKIIDYYRKNASKTSANGLFDEKKASSVSESFFNQKGGWSSTNEMILDWGAEEHLLDNADFQKVLAYCLEDLPGNWHTAITAKYLLEKKAEDICQELGITTSNYWQIIHRAKLMLKKCIEAGWKFDS